MEYLEARNGDWLAAPFQCETCHFINIHKRYPIQISQNDTRLLKMYRRVNLDVFWSRRPGTVRSIVNGLEYIVNTSRIMNMPVPLPEVDTWPISDTVGMGLAVVILQGKQEQTVTHAYSLP